MILFAQISFPCQEYVLELDSLYLLKNLLHIYCNPSPKDKVLSLSHGLSSHPLLTSSASTAQAVSSIVDAGAPHMSTTGGINSPGLLSTLNSPSEPTTNNIINLLATTSNSPESFETNNGHNSSSAITHHPLASHPPIQTQLLPTQHSADTLDHNNRSGIHVIHSPENRMSHGNNHPNNNNSSPIATSERMDNSKLESLENGGNDHSPKYISL